MFGLLSPAIGFSSLFGQARF